MVKVPKLQTWAQRVAHGCGCLTEATRAHSWEIGLPVALTFPEPRAALSLALSGPHVRLLPCSYRFASYFYLLHFL